MNKVVFYFIRKYINSPKKELFRFDSVFMIVGLIVSVATLTIALSIFDGYEKVLKKTILGVNSHIYIFNYGDQNLGDEKIKKLTDFLQTKPEVAGFSPIVMSQAMASKMASNIASNKERIKGCLVRGIDWQKKEQPTKYREFITEGTHILRDKNEVVIGYKLAQKLGVAVGDSIKLISTLNSAITPMGMKPSERKCCITGLYNSGMYEYDMKYVFMNYEAAFELLSTDEYSMMEVKLKDEFVEKADYYAYLWTIELDNDFQISSWIDFNGNLFSLLELEKWVIFIILSFLILIASFNVVSSVSTMILLRKQDIGILKAFGASDKVLRSIFLTKTLITSLIAVLSGQLIGIFLSIMLSKQTFLQLKGDVYFLEKINVSFGISSLGLTLLVSLMIVFFAALIPLKKISLLEVNNILRS